MLTAVETATRNAGTYTWEVFRSPSAIDFRLHAGTIVQNKQNLSDRLVAFGAIEATNKREARQQALQLAREYGITKSGRAYR